MRVHWATTRLLCLASVCCVAGASLTAPVRAAPLPTAGGAAKEQVVPIGPVHQIAVDPRAPQTVYAGTEGNGVFRSENGGATWAGAARGLPPGAAIDGLVVSPSGTVYAATPDGVFKSASHGAAWSTQGPPTGSGSLSLALAPDAATLYAGTEGDGIYRSDNGGATWAAIGPSRAVVQVVAADPVGGTILYAGTDDGLLIDAGAGWRRAGLGHVSVQALAISAANPLTLYAGTPSGVLLSRDGGATWARAGLRTIDVTTLSVSATDARDVYAGSSQGGGLYGSANGGHTWHALTAGLSSANVYALAFDPSDPAVAYAGLDRGVFKSLQAGLNWASSTIYDRSVAALVQPGGGNPLYYAATNGGVYSSSDGTIWASAGLGNHAVADLLVLPATGAITTTTVVAATDTGVYLSADGGRSWTYTLRLRANALAAMPGTTTIFAGTTRGLFRSSDSGRRWDQLPMGSGIVDTLLLFGSRLYFGGSGGVASTDDLGAHFGGSGLQGDEVVQLVLGPPGPGGPIILARDASGRIYRASAGGHWTEASVGGQTATAMSEAADGNLYAATGAGIYRSSNSGVSWILTHPQGATGATTQSPTPRIGVLQPALNGGPSTLLEGLTDQGVIEETLSVLPTSPFAPLLNSGIGRYYATTGHFVRAPFLDWYLNSGGEAILGLPRTEARREHGQLVQYFQNAELIYQPENADTPQVIALAPLGAQALGAQALGAPAARIAAFENTTTRRYFPQTGHSLSGEFLSFWRRYGGLTVFGLPISEPLESSGRLVQYFQNARLEVDESVGDTFFHTRLSPLGDALLKEKGWLQ